MIKHSRRVAANKTETIYNGHSRMSICVYLNGTEYGCGNSLRLARVAAKKRRDK